MLKSKLGSLKIEKAGPFAIPGLIIVFILFSGLFLIQPRLTEVFSIQRDLKKEEKRLAQLTAKTAALEGLDQVELSQKTEIVAKVLPGEKDLPLLLFVVKNIAAKNNIELRSLEVEPGELATPSAEGKDKGEEEELPFLSFEIVVGGQMSDLKEFLAQLANTAPLMGAKSVEIEIGGGSFQADLLLDSPFLPPPVTLGVPEKPLLPITGEEEETYQKLARLNFSLIQEEMPSVPGGKEDLFAF